MRSGRPGRGRRAPVDRTALVITVIGWCSATGCIQPGMVSTGTMALDTNDTGKTSSDMPGAARTLPAIRPIHTNTHMKAKPNSVHGPKAARASSTPPCRRNPTAKPMAVVTARPRTSRPVSATARPAMSASRDTGSNRRRSVTPARGLRPPRDDTLLPVNRTLVTTQPGTRKST